MANVVAVIVLLSARYRVPLPLVPVPMLNVATFAVKVERFDISSVARPAAPVLDELATVMLEDDALTAKVPVPVKAAKVVRPAPTWVVPTRKAPASVSV